MEVLARYLLSAYFQGFDSMHVFLTDVMSYGFGSWGYTTIKADHFEIVQLKTQILNIITKIFQNHISPLLDLVFYVILLIGQLHIQIPNQLVLEVVKFLCR